MAKYRKRNRKASYAPQRNGRSVAQCTATRMPKTMPTRVARVVACRNTLTRAAGNNPCGSARWTAKYRKVPDRATDPSAHQPVLPYALCREKGVRGERWNVLTRDEHSYAKRDQRCAQRTRIRSDCHPTPRRAIRACAHGDAEELHESYMDQKNFLEQKRV